MKVFLTGATGFVGSHFVAYCLERSYEVGILCRENSKTDVFGNGLSFLKRYVYDNSTKSIISALSQMRPDVVIHLATYYKPKHQTEDVENLISSNILYGTQLVEAMTQTGNSLLINFGTILQNFKNEEYFPTNLYSATKEAFHDILRYYVLNQQLRVITLKLSDTYGVNDKRDKILNLLISSALNRTRIDLTLGEQYVDLVYIDDVVRAIDCAIVRLLKNVATGQECFSVQSNNPIKVKDLVPIVSEICQTNLEVNWGTVPYRSYEIFEPITVIERLPGWQPRIDLRTGIKLIVDSRKKVT